MLWSTWRCAPALAWPNTFARARVLGVYTDTHDTSAGCVYITGHCSRGGHGRLQPPILLGKWSLKRINETFSFIFCSAEGTRGPGVSERGKGETGEQKRREKKKKGLLAEAEELPICSERMDTCNGEGVCRSTLSIRCGHTCYISWDFPFIDRTRERRPLHLLLALSSHFLSSLFPF